MNKTIILTLLCFCGCAPDLHKGVYVSDKHTIEVASDATLQVDGKDCIHYTTHPEQTLKATVDGVEVVYYVEVPSSTKFVLTAKTNIGHNDLSGVYIKDDNSTKPVPIDELKQLKIKRKVCAGKLEKLDTVLLTMSTQIATKTQKLKSLGIKSSADIKDTETRQLAQDLVAMTKDRDNLDKAKKIISTKLDEIDRGIEQLETNTSEISDKELEELLASIADKRGGQPKTPVESIESNDILTKALGK
ncbi:MAG: hypothetical protein M0R80_01450 [Proteobacteria bacterium]|jgi:hypothetical protein|nr:hypothetical protein [Pseudomonadota bacterium]